jgi:hypothetical protein
MKQPARGGKVRRPARPYGRTSATGPTHDDARGSESDTQACVVEAAGRRRRRATPHAASKSVQIEDPDEGAAEKEQEQPLADELEGTAVPALAIAPDAELPVVPVVPEEVPLVAALPAVAPPPVPDDDAAPLLAPVVAPLVDASPPEAPLALSVDASLDVPLAIVPASTGLVATPVAPQKSS